MRIEKEHKDRLNLAFNESTINWIDIKANSIEVLLDCISMSSDGNFPEDNRLKFVFSDYGRIAVSYRKGEWDDETAEIITIIPNELKKQFNGLKLDSMYGWEFINLDNDDFDKWKTKISLDQINNSNWEELNTIDLFAEQIANQAVTIDVRIWFSDFKIFNHKNLELTKKEFVENGERGWNQLYKTGIETDNHKTKKIEKGSTQHGI
jgi:hypothetical protein